jgi:membrane-bound lytic murein transglycosylase A
MMNRNPSVVFFRSVDDSKGAIGAEGVALTPRRSLAVDPAFIPLGAPLWLNAEGGDEKIARLMVAQDTGGAIKGAVRGDMFWGAGVDAENKAGAMQLTGTYYLLLPRTVDVHERD